MKNLNKVLAMLVVFMMMLSTVAFASSFTDVADTSSYSTAIEVGVDLGLIKGYEDGTFKPEGEITRAEFAAIVVRLLGQEAQAAGAKASTQFVDVPADHWAAGYVNIAVQAGVINGYGDGNFGPEDLVEYQDAITMMVRALGYEPAIGSAGYPTGYLTKAGELGLTTGVNGSNGVAANRGAVAQIAFNALDVPLMTQSGYGTFTQFVINDGYSHIKRTLLSENHSTVKLQGTVMTSSDATSTSTTADSYVMVKVTDGLRNKFEIGPVTYTDPEDKEEKIKYREYKMFTGASDAMNYVGKKVIVFAEYDEFEDKLTVKSLYEVNSDVVTIDIADFDNFYKKDNKDYKADTIKYYINENKTDSVTISSSASLFYNGFKAAEIDWAKLANMSGTIELSLLNSNTADADYDTIYVTAFDTFVVDKVSASSKVVKGKFNAVSSFKKTIKFDESNGDVKATLVDANGNAMEWTSLEEYDVLSVKYVDAGAKEIFEAKVVENVVTGTVTSRSGDIGSKIRYVEIDGTEYKVLPGIEAETVAGEIRLGDEGTYYLDDNNNIVFHNATITRNNNYALVLTAGKMNDDFDAPKVKVLTKESGVATVELANKITVMYKGVKANNIAVKTFKKDITDIASKDGYKVFADLKDKEVSYLEGKVVTYKLNAAGQVSFIEIPEASAKKGEDWFTVSSSITALSDYDKDRASFVSGGAKYYLTDNTVVFYAGATVKDDYEVVSLNNLADGKILSDVTVYDVSDDRTIGALVINNKETFNPVFENATFVTKKGNVTNEDGEEVIRVTGYADGEEVTYICKDGTVVNVGDLVVPEFAANGDVDSFVVVNNIDATTQANKDAGIKGLKGTLAVYEEAGEYFSPINSAKGFIHLDKKDYDLSKSVNVYVYDKTKEKTSRVCYVVDADLDYISVEIDDIKKPDATWWEESEKMVGKKVTAYLYFYEDEVVDVLYYIETIPAE